MRKRSAVLALTAAPIAVSAPALAPTSASAAGLDSTICRIVDNSANVIARQGLAGHTTLHVAESFPHALLPRTGGRFDVRVEWHNTTTGKKGYSLRSVPVTDSAPAASFIDLPVGRGTTVYRVQATEWTFSTFSGTCVGRFRSR